MGTAHWAMLIGILAVAACKGDDYRSGRSADSAGMTDHLDSGGMSMQGMQMMPHMRAHMDSMARMSPEQMQARMATHQRTMSQMLDRMGADMRGMQMSGNSNWNALTDSVKQDLAELSNLRGEALSTRMQAHADRARRLIAAHEQMMQGMH
jgi:hypothetical protein